jgi:alcohol dehydrogenase class IV
MTARFENATKLIAQLRGEKYVHGLDVAQEAGRLCGQLGRRALLVRDAFPGSGPFLETVTGSLAARSVEILGVVDGAAPNAPREDVARITSAVTAAGPDVVVSFGGGSTIDAAKAACVLQTLGGIIDDYFGTGLVTKRLAEGGEKLTSHLAIQTAASSGAHLTKYSNITDVKTGQKKLIIDEAIVPGRALFDYAVTLDAPPSLTVDGALDGLSHVLEVLFSAVGKPHYGLTEALAREAIGLVLEFTPKVLENPASREGREALGRATDLGGYSIMVGGTNGAHLTSFSLVDILSHGRACGLLNPYYTVFFAPAVQSPLKLVAALCEHHGYAEAGSAGLEGRALGEAVANALIAFEKKIGVPSRLDDVPGFSERHIERALRAAKDPQLKMKLENMPVPLTADMVDDYMGPVLHAAATGDLAGIRNV